jgi:hypothetical protein
MRGALIGSVAVACVALAASARARHEAAPFYQGQQVTILVNFAAGGPTDERAIAAMQSDPAYVTDATTAFGYVPDHVAGPDTSERVRRALNIKPDVQTHMQSYIGER